MHAHPGLLTNGIAAIIIFVVVYIFVFKINSRIEKAQFLRRNNAGVEEFESYEKMQRTRLKETITLAITSILLAVSSIYFLGSMLGLALYFLG